MKLAILVLALFFLATSPSFAEKFAFAMSDAEIAMALKKAGAGTYIPIAERTLEFADWDNEANFFMFCLDSLRSVHTDSSWEKVARTCGHLQEIASRHHLNLDAMLGKGWREKVLRGRRHLTYKEVFGISERYPEKHAGPRMGWYY